MKKLIEIWNGRFGLIMTLISIVGMIIAGAGWFLENKYFKQEFRKEIEENKAFRSEVRRYIKCNDSTWSNQNYFNGQIDMYIQMDME